ncbi:MAG: Asp-tRNA(Asn)/Glu-tRNA(Gln) amidotransferase subunit GatC [Patescibacteria group bacterium]
MAIDKSTVAKVAKLARINNNPDEEFLEKYSKELSSILDYINQLQEVDTSGISPVDGIRTIKINQLREDTPDIDQTKYSRIRRNIINNFPNKQGDLLLLPGIFEEN